MNGKVNRWFEIRLVDCNRHEEIHRFPIRSKAIAYAMRRSYRYLKCSLYRCTNIGSLFDYSYLETLWDELA